MSFAHPQHSRTRPHHSQRTPRQWDDNDSDLATSESADSEVLLFAPPPSARSTATATQAQGEWEVISAFARRPSPGSTARSSSTKSSTPRDPSPASLSHSLFPSHDGNGIFTTSLSDSLVISEVPSIYASAADLDGAYITPSDEDASIPSSEDRASYRLRHSIRRVSVAGTTTSSFSDLSHPSYSGSSIGGSWALTSEALSTLPDVSSSSAAHIARPSSAAFTSDSSEDESQGDVRGTPRRGERRRTARYDEQEDEDEDLLSRTPQAASAGIGAFARRRKEAGEKESRSSREAYPSPPPERLSKVKRRHRQSGRTGGSQKRSSTSGSVGVEVRIRGSARKPESRREDVEEQRANELRTEVEKEVFLGNFFGKVMDVDTATLHLIANADPTPTPSRSSSPNHSPLSSYHSRPRARVVHGFAALSRHANEELGHSHFHFGGELDTEMYDVDEESGVETETEAAPWSRTHDGAELGRSHSLSSLPRALFDGVMADVEKPKTLRRTSSLLSSGREGNGREGGMENAWGGEFEGLEAAMSYWRRILRRMRGY